MKLDRAKESVKVLNRVLHESFKDITDYRQDVTTFLLLAEVHTQVYKRMTSSHPNNNFVASVSSSAGTSAASAGQQEEKSDNYVSTQPVQDALQRAYELQREVLARVSII
jgi:hypothetical protein